MGFQSFLFEYHLWNGNLSVSQGRTGGHPSITEMESDMSRCMGGLRGGDQSFFKKQYGAWWVGVGGAEGKQKGEGEGAGGGQWRWWNKIWIKIKEDGKWVGMWGAGLDSSTISHRITVTESWRICRCGTATEKSSLLHLSQSWWCSCAVSLRMQKWLLLGRAECWFLQMIHTWDHYKCDNCQTTETFRLHLTCLFLLAFFIYATCCAALFVLLPFSTRRQISVSQKDAGNNNKE